MSNLKLQGTLRIKDLDFSIASLSFEKIHVINAKYFSPQDCQNNFNFYTNGGEGPKPVSYIFKNKNAFCLYLCTDPGNIYNLNNNYDPDHLINDIVVNATELCCNDYIPASGSMQFAIQMHASGAPVIIMRGNKGVAPMEQKGGKCCIIFETNLILPSSIEVMPGSPTSTCTISQSYQNTVYIDKIHGTFITSGDSNGKTLNLMNYSSGGEESSNSGFDHFFATECRDKYPTRAGIFYTWIPKFYTDLDFDHQSPYAAWSLYTVIVSTQGIVNEPFIRIDTGVNQFSWTGYTLDQSDYTSLYALKMSGTRSTIRARGYQGDTEWHEYE